MSSLREKIEEIHMGDLKKEDETLSFLSSMHDQLANGEKEKFTIRN